MASAFGKHIHGAALGCLVLLVMVRRGWTHGTADASSVCDSNACQKDASLLQAKAVSRHIPKVTATQYLQLEASQQEGVAIAPMLKRTLSSASLPSSGSTAGSSFRSFAGNTMTGVVSNMAFNAIGAIPGLKESPIGFLFSDSTDISNEDLYDKLSQDLKKGFDDVKNQMTNMEAQLKHHITGEIHSQTEALTGLITQGTSEILGQLTQNAQENKALLSSFRDFVAKNHKEAMQFAAEQLFETTYRQCLEYSTDIVTKYELYTMMLGDLLSQRRQALVSYRPGDFGSVDGCGVGYVGIYSEGLCRDAAVALGYDFQQAKSYANDYPGCFLHPAKKMVWFNTHQAPAGTWEPQAAGQLCKTQHMTFEPGEVGKVHGCNTGYAGIYSEGLCREAAASLGYTFKYAGSHPNDYPGCYYNRAEKLVWFNTHQAPAGTWAPQEAGQLCQPDGSGAHKRMADMMVKEAGMLHSFLSNSGMGTAADVQRLLACFLQSEYNSNSGSLLGKYLNVLTHDTEEQPDGTEKNPLDISERLSAQALMMDLIDTSLLAVDMQDMQLAIVDHFSMQTRLAYAAKVGQQLDEAWALLRQELHEAQIRDAVQTEELKFLHSLPDNVVVVEHGSGSGATGGRCLDHASTSAELLETPELSELAEYQEYNAGFLAKQSREAIKRCAQRDSCQEAIVWAIKQCVEEEEEDEEKAYTDYYWHTAYYWSLSSTLTATGCGAAYPEAITFWSSKKHSDYQNLDQYRGRISESDAREVCHEDDGTIVGFAAFAVRRK